MTIVRVPIGSDNDRPGINVDAATERIIGHGFIRRQPGDLLPLIADTTKNVRRAGVRVECEALRADDREIAVDCNAYAEPIILATVRRSEFDDRNRIADRDFTVVGNGVVITVVGQSLRAAG